MENATLLYPLTPFALGQWECEGIVSYLCRLAAAHTVAVDDLVNRCLSTCSDTDFRKWRHFSWWNRKQAVSVFSPGRTAPLSEALAKATGIAEVHLLSLATLTQSLDLAGLSAVHARHCPRCFREQPYYEAYRPILWDIQVVSACPAHGVRLVLSECGCRASCRLPTWYRRQIPGICTTCGSFGFACANNPETRATEEDLWLAGQIGELVAAVSAGEQFQFEEVRRGVTAMAHVIGDGQPYRAAPICGLNKARLFDWIKGVRRIKLSPLLALCAASGSDLVLAMRGQPNARRRRSFRYVCHPRRSAYPSIAERKRAILDSLKDPGCPSVRSVAEALGVSTRSMECIFPEDTRKIAERFQLARRAATIARRAEATQCMSEVIERLKANGRPITVRNIHCESGILVTRGSRYESILRELCDDHEVKQTEGKDAEEETLHA